MPTSGEIRINGLVFINNKPAGTLKPQPPVIHHLREAGAIGHTAAGKTHQLAPAAGPIALAPGAAAAVQAALGKDGTKRIGRILTAPGDRFSAGTHTRSGYLKDKDGKLILDKKGHKIPYGCAFDVHVDREKNKVLQAQEAQAMARKLRLEGIAAWYRAPRSESGEAGSGAHIHCVWPGAPTDNGQNEQQISSFVQGYKALANHTNPHSDWVDRSITPDEVKAVEAAYAQGDHTLPLDQVPSYDEKHTSLKAKKRKG